jgi:hypothetical protein
MNLLHSLHSEFRKTRHTSVPYLAAITAALVPAVFFIDICVGGAEPDTMKDLWNAILSKGFLLMGGAILPLFTVLLATLLPQIDYRNGTWKNVLLTPQPRWRIYVARFVHLQLLLLLTIALFDVLLLGSAGGMQLLRPEMRFGMHSGEGWSLASWSTRTYLALFAISALQFWLGLCCRSFIVPLGIGFALWLLSAFLLFDMDSKLAGGSPFAYPLVALSPGLVSRWSTALWSSMGLGTGFLLLGFLQFRRRAF